MGRAARPPPCDPHPYNPLQFYLQILHGLYYSRKLLFVNLYTFIVYSLKITEKKPRLNFLKLFYYTYNQYLFIFEI